MAHRLTPRRLRSWRPPKHRHGRPTAIAATANVAKLCRRRRCQPVKVWTAHTKRARAESSVTRERRRAGWVFRRSGHGPGAGLGGRTFGSVACRRSSRGLRCSWSGMSDSVCGRRHNVSSCENGVSSWLCNARAVSQGVSPATSSANNQPGTGFTLYARCAQMLCAKRSAGTNLHDDRFRAAYWPRGTARESR